jgi:hypothetical protein
MYMCPIPNGFCDRVFHCTVSKTVGKKKLRRVESASELYRSSDRRRSAKLLPTLADGGCHVVSATTPYDRNFQFSRPGAAIISSK